MIDFRRKAGRSEAQDTRIKLGWKRERRKFYLSYEESHRSEKHIANNMFFEDFLTVKGKFPMRVVLDQYSTAGTLAKYLFKVDLMISLVMRRDRFTDA